MSTHLLDTPEPATGNRDRRKLLEQIPARERRLKLAGVETAFLEGGEGASIVLLHGPGESAVKWFRVYADLAETNRVIAPDLPAHGESAVPEGAFDEERALAWLGELCERTCPDPPTLVGHVLGGSIAARFAIERPAGLNRLVLVDTLGLARFRPTPRFGFTMAKFLTRPNPRTYDRFMRQCSVDLDSLQEEMGELWDPFESYNIETTRSPKSKAAGRMMRRLGLPRIPEGRLERIAVPTTLIWGRQDRANRVRIAERASERFGWPLHVIDDCADDPPRDRPEAFLRALRAA